MMIGELVVCTGAQFNQVLQGDRCLRKLIRTYSSLRWSRYHFHPLHMRAAACLGPAGSRLPASAKSRLTSSKWYLL